MMASGYDGLGSEDFNPTLSNLDVFSLDESILCVVGEDGRARPWVDPLLSPTDDDDDDDLYDDEDDEDLDDFDDFDEDDEDFFDDDEDLDEDEDDQDDEEGF
ncbi:MAG: hypothetical protein JSU68_12700 [Phycisphaerales bacterium]|nr:MAG: hypothetical protein JSU68_12700 [Phycisphaerales bacterium]